MLFLSRHNLQQGEQLAKRVYFVGAHSTGKTTLSSFMAKKLHWVYIPEQSRLLLAEYRIGLDEIRKDLDKSAEFQLEIWRRQREAESNACGNFVSDRSFDNIAYAASATLIASEMHQSLDFRQYVEDLKVDNSITFFVRPHVKLIHNDGVRTDWDWASVNRIDGMIEYILETEGIPYIPLESMSMKSRVRTVEGVLHAAGVPCLG